MKIRYIFSVIIISFLYASCYDDKGNYDYVDFTDVIIKDIEDSYNAVSFQDTLRITPDIELDHGQFEYLWMINEAYVGTQYIEIKWDTIGKEKTLVYPVSLPNGNYEITLKATDSETEYSVFYNTQLIVKTEFSLGFYVLKETEDGLTEVDLHTPDKVLENLITKSLGNAMNGKPKSMGLMFSYCHLDPENPDEYLWPRALSVCTENDIKIFNLNNWNTILTHEDMYYGERPANDKPLYLGPNGFSIAYFSTAGICYNYQSKTQGLASVGKYGLPVVVMENGVDIKCKPSEHVIYSDKTFGSFLYDELNRRFLGFTANYAISTFKDDGEFPANNLPEDYKLLYLGYNSFGSASAYAIFADGHQKKYLYHLDLSKRIVKDKQTLEGRLADAVLYANNETQANVVYGVVDNEVWMYSVESGEEQRLNLNELDGEITYVSNRYWTNDAIDSQNNFNYLAVGTHKYGKYRIYLFNTIGGKPTGGSVRILKGEGKVVKVHFNSPGMPEDNAKAQGGYPISSN